MSALLNPLSFLVACISGWLNEHHRHAIEYLAEENRVLREQIGERRLHFTDDQRRRLAVRAAILSWDDPVDEKSSGLNKLLESED